jgi:hypothetical protein
MATMWSYLSFGGPSIASLCRRTKASDLPASPIPGVSVITTVA